VVARASFAAPIRCSQQRVDLRLIEVAHRGLGSLFGGNCSHFGAPCEVLRAVTADEFR
jgi:hypothetical protein